MMLIAFIAAGFSVAAQEAVRQNIPLTRTDSLRLQGEKTQQANTQTQPKLNVQNKDSLRTSKDSIAKDSIPKKKGLEARVDYQSTDSMVMTAGNLAYLYGEGDVKYQQIELTSDFIQMNMDSSLVYATFGHDSTGAETGFPLFKEGSQQYESKTMRYNFGSKKGYITNVITQQGEGFVTAGLTKKMDNDILNMKGGQYTTCDEHEHPHFYIQMTKAKVRPNKNIVTGPVYLVIEDVPLYPIGLPFCFFPFTDTYSSGILMPTFGDESTRGFYLQNGGYYFALSDYMDLSVTGDIYTKGSWGLKATSQYRKRYKYSGNFDAAYQVTKLGDKGLSDYSLSKDFQIRWTHTQDSKANPYLSLSASVNFSTSSYSRNNMTSIYNSEATQNTKGSSVNITKRFANNPFTISANMSVTQRTADSALAVTLPNLTATMTRIYPFKRKNAVGSERWYEKISMSYTGSFSNSIDTKENMILHSNFQKDWKNAVQHNIPVSATFTLLNYLQISPSFNYRERWYTNKIEKEYDSQKQSLVARDTTYGFYRVYDYNASVSASTTLYGFFKPLPFFGDKVQMIRHRMEPSISFSATPDFGSSRYGYYRTYVYQDANGVDHTEYYSPFANGMYGVPSRGRTGSIGFSVNNNVEMKIRSNADSTGFKKISLIDQLSLSGSYNLAADSFQWSNLSASLRLKLTKSYTLQLSGIFDTYTYNENGQRVNIPRWRAGKGFGRLMATQTSFSYTFNQDTFKKWFGDKDEKKGKQPVGKDANGNTPETQSDENNLETTTGGKEGGGRLLGQKKDTGETDADGYLITTVPWSLTFNYSLTLGYNSAKFNRSTREYAYKLTHALSFNGNIQPTKNWKFNFNATYDFDNHKLSYMTCNITRNMHCFQMTASVIPVGRYKSYAMSIAVSSSLLKDLKYDKRSDYRNGQTWY